MEMEPGLNTSQVVVELEPYQGAILLCLHESIRKYIVSKDNTFMALAISALRNWVVTGHITLSSLNSIRCDYPAGVSLLSCLVQLLSHAGTAVVQEEAVYVHTAQTLIEALQVPTDSCTDSRMEACSVLMKAILETGFLTAALLNNVSWEDAAGSIAALASTFVAEEIDRFLQS
jgi:hypothetical protein